MEAEVICSVKHTVPHTCDTLLCRRGFVQFVYEPIKTIIECCMADNRDKLWKLTDSLGVTPRLKA